MEVNKLETPVSEMQENVKAVKSLLENLNSKFDTMEMRLGYVEMQINAMNALLLANIGSLV